MAKRRGDAGKELFWRRHLARWRRSKQTIRDYCASEGLSEPSFYGWRRCLAVRDHISKAQNGKRTPPSRTKTRSRSNDRGSGAAFIPLRPVDDPGIAAAPATKIEIVLAGGRVLRVGPGFDAATLRRLLAVLEGPSC